MFAHSVCHLQYLGPSSEYVMWKRDRKEDDTFIDTPTPHPQSTFVFNEPKAMQAAARGGWIGSRACELWESNNCSHHHRKKAFDRLTWGMYATHSAHSHLKTQLKEKWKSRHQRILPPDPTWVHIRYIIVLHHFFS